MKTILNTILFLAFGLSASCSAQVPPTQPQDNTPQKDAVPLVWKTVTYCTYKYDSKYNIEFFPENKSEKHPTYLPELTVYYIIDTKGTHWIVNQYDMENYTCISKQEQRKAQ